jgi:hypothetical protein
MGGPEGPGCKQDNWQVEEYSFYGNQEDVKAKISKANIGLGRRLFFAVAAVGDSGNINEYERKSGNTYSVRSAEVGAKSARAFSSDVQQAIFDNKGRECVGEKVHQLTSYKAIRFGAPKEVSIDENTVASHAKARSNEDFVGLSVQLLC